MAIITDYNSLIQNVKDLAEDDGLEFSNFIPTAIDLAEERLYRELELPDVEVKATGLLTINNPILNKPSGYRFSQVLSVTVSGKKVQLRRKTDSYMDDYWPDSSVVGVPKYYSDTSELGFRLAPTPDQAYGYELRYSKKPDKLNSSNTTNYYSNNCSDILFNATMVEMTKFMKAWSQVPVFEQTYTNLREGWNIQEQRARRDAGLVPMAPDSGENNLKHTIGSNS